MSNLHTIRNGTKQALRSCRVGQGLSLVECISYRWSPGLGDPTIFGWFTVVAYLVAASVCFQRARDEFAAIPPETGTLKAFWLGAAILLFLLAINKQMDFQTLLTAAGRCLARAQGWYEERRSIQASFIIGLLVVSAGFFGLALWALRRHIRREWLVLTGFFILIVFVLMRASSFHHMDQFINTRLWGIRMNWLFELGALGMIVAGARKRRLFVRAN